MMPRLVSGAEAVTLESLQQCFPVRMDKFQERSGRLLPRSPPAS